MTNDFLVSESAVRSGVFFLGFFVFMSLGLLRPFRTGDQNRKFIRFHNFALIAVNALMQKALGPLTLIALATYIEKKDLGLFNFLDLNFAIEFIATLIIMDFVIYGQHLVTHRVPILWRLHRVHHTDTGFDTSTALRFHPLETLVSLGTKAFFVAVLGIAPLSIFVFEILINFAAMFHHSNFSLPYSLEKVLRLFIVTPDMHRIHHSVRSEETDSNFSFFISAWDKIFGTYTHAPQSDPVSMTIGLETDRELEKQSFLSLLKQPFGG